MQRTDILKINKFIRDTINTQDIKKAVNKIKNQIPRNIIQYSFDQSSKPKQLKNQLLNLFGKARNKENLYQKQIFQLAFYKRKTNNWINIAQT
ncbi:unnamed protein product [Paramecium octaurelia]|uniref:Uncharacterized protein n=1 Tax=Paramecium octaurelia TaxID=43137 RepID=A0A8S1WCP2_PAROT|nr:unnamed protein product [Paramecium octaurelia]